MKIYILPIDKRFQPESQKYMFPKHNKDFGVEQDFYNYLLASKMIVNNPQEADWHYLPIFWTRWHVNHDFGQYGLEELQKEVSRVILDDKKTFTICQYDDGPLVNVGETTNFLSARIRNSGIDIPILSSLHKKPFLKQKKKYLTSFIGNFESHIIRQEIADLLSKREDVSIIDTRKNKRSIWNRVFPNRYTNIFIKMVLQSYISLCPRGSSGSSFRSYESMQLGVVPFFIGDIDVRPFKKFINWDEISFYSDNAQDVVRIIDSVSKEQLISMGEKSKKVYEEKLTYGKWCPFVIKELL